MYADVKNYFVKSCYFSAEVFTSAVFIYGNEDNYGHSGSFSAGIDGGIRDFADAPRGAFLFRMVDGACARAAFLRVLSQGAVS